MSTIPNPLGNVPMDQLASYSSLRDRIEAGELITYEEAEETYTDDMLWDNAWRGHDRTEEPGEGYYAADCRRFATNEPLNRAESL